MYVMATISSRQRDIGAEPVIVCIVDLVLSNGAGLFPIANQHIRVKHILLATTKPKLLHQGI